jgi:hypothetical protein
MGKPQERDPSLHESKEERLSNLVMEFTSKKYIRVCELSWINET